MTQSTLDDYQDSGSIDHTDPETLRRLYHDEGLSLPEITELSDVEHDSTIHYHMDKHDIERRDRISATQEASRVDYAWYGYAGDPPYPAWQATHDNSRDTVKVHRLLAVAEYGVEAVKDKVVHHKNGVKWDNRPGNIELYTPEKHTELHARKDIDFTQRSNG